MPKRIQTYLVYLVVIVLLSVLPALAQETTPDPQPTPEATEAVVVTETTPSPTEVIVTAEPTETTPTPTDEVVVIPPPETTAEVTPEVTDVVETTAEPEVTPEVTEEAPVVVIPPDGDGYGTDQPVVRSSPTTSTLPQIPTTGDVTIIVGLNMQRGRSGAGSTGPTSGMNVAYSQTAIRQAQEALSVNMQQFGANIITQFSEFPAMAMTVNQQGLAYLRTSDMVQYVQPVEYRQQDLNTSLDLIGVTTNGGQTLNIDETGVTEGGPGWVVAVIDGMPNSGHSFLQGRTVSPMCWNSGNGVTTSTPGTAACPYDAHGTHVSGIVAGGGSVQLSGGISPLNGVARGARIMPLGVFPANQSIGASDLDILAALNYVYAQRNTYPIAAVNMSLGGGRFTAICDSSYPAYYNITALLRGAGIAVVAASGNNGYTTAMSAPACVSNIISVGAVDDSDNVALFTNYASFLDLMAPGVSIWSSNATTGSFSNMQGTSQASPHVAGTFALLREASPTATVDSLLALLKQYGPVVSDPTYTTLTWRRIQVDRTLGQVYNLVTPTNNATLNYRTATFQWEAAELADYYELFVQNVVNPAAPTMAFQKWYQVGVSPELSCNSTTCTVTTTDMNMVSGGNLRWYVRAYNATYGYDPYLGPLAFTLAAPTTSTPTGTVTTPLTGLVTYTWTGFSDASYYQLYVANSSGAGVVDEWISAGTAGCGGGGTCSFTPTTPVLNGVNTWYIRAYKSNTYGAWSTARNFTMSAAAPGVPTLNTPTSLGTVRPVLSFSAPTGTTWLRVYVISPTTVIMDQWFTRTAACGSPSATTCNLVQVNTDLVVNTTYTYYVQAYGAGGTGNWQSTGTTFNLTITTPPLPTNLTQDAVAKRGYLPTFTWQESNETATYYELVVYTAGWATKVHQQWYQRGNSIMTCGSGTCSVTPPNFALLNQNYVWGVRAYNASGLSVGGPYNNGYETASIDMTGFTAPQASQLAGFQAFNVQINSVDDPFFQWNDIDNANYYELYINNSAGTVLHQQWYARPAICNAGVCTAHPANLYFTNGNYGFYVRAYGPAGLSVGGPFGNGYNGTTLEVQADSQITNQRPANLTRVTVAEDNTPNLQWDEVIDGTWYRVYITNASTGAVVLDQWKHFSSINCGLINTQTQCLWVNVANFANGNYNWWVQGYSPAGYSKWSDSNGSVAGDQPHLFTVAVPAPGTATLSAPTNGAVDPDGSVTFTWSVASNTTYYYLRVLNTATNTNAYAQWLASSAVCTSSCTTTLTLPPGNYTWEVSTYGPGTVGTTYPSSGTRTLVVLD